MATANTWTGLTPTEVGVETEKRGRGYRMFAEILSDGRMLRELENVARGEDPFRKALEHYGLEEPKDLGIYTELANKLREREGKPALEYGYGEGLYVLRWSIDDASGQGTPVSAETGVPWVRLGNAKHGPGTHWLEQAPVNHEANREVTDAQ